MAKKAEQLKGSRLHHVREERGCERKGSIHKGSKYKLRLLVFLSQILSDMEPRYDLGAAVSVSSLILGHGEGGQQSALWDKTTPTGGTEVALRLHSNFMFCVWKFKTKTV